MRTNTNLIIKTFLVIAVLLMLSINTYSRIDLNGSGDGYTGQSLRKNAAGDSTINNLIEDAAADFLQAHSDSVQFSSLYELADSGLDYDACRQVVESALVNLRNAQEKYEELINIAENTPYYQPVIEKLLVFDYNGYKQTNGLNSGIFGEVESFLSVGNINGAYGNVLERVKKIEETLNMIAVLLNDDSMPLLADVWRLNDECSKKILFGQYVAEVFLAIRESN